jgi:hypothetical protein
VNLGYHDYDALGFPKPHEVKSTRPERGWIALGEHVYRTEHAKGGWSWLDPFPMTRIGKSVRLYHVPLDAAIETASPEEEVLLPIAGTIGVVGGPVGTWFRVDQIIRNTGTRRIRVLVSACGMKPSPCELALDPGQTERLASAPGKQPFILVTFPRVAEKQLEFSTVVRASQWPEIAIPAVSESAFQQESISIPAVPTNARLNLRVWLRSASGAPIVVRLYAPRSNRLIAEKQFAADPGGYFANGDLAIESTGSQVWAMMTTTDYRTGKIVLSLPR